MGKPPFDDLVHRRVIILIGQPLQLKPFVTAFIGLSRLKYHHAGNDIRSGNVGNIVGFNSHRRLHPQHFAEKCQCRADALILARHPLCFLLSVFAGQLHQTYIVPSLRHQQLWLSPQLLLQQLGK